MARTVPTTPNRRPALPRHGNAASGAAATSATRGGAVDVILMRIRLIPSAAPVSLPFFPIGRGHAQFTHDLGPGPAPSAAPISLPFFPIVRGHAQFTRDLGPGPAPSAEPISLPFFQLCVATHNSLTTSKLHHLRARTAPRVKPSRVGCVVMIDVLRRAIP